MESRNASSEPDLIDKGFALAFYACVTFILTKKISKKSDECKFSLILAAFTTFNNHKHHIENGAMHFRKYLSDLWQRLPVENDILNTDPNDKRFYLFYCLSHLLTNILSKEGSRRLDRITNLSLILASFTICNQVYEGKWFSNKTKHFKEYVSDLWQKIPAENELNSTPPRNYGFRRHGI